MELKSDAHLRPLVPSLGSNRTFMELKLIILFYAVFFFCCSNRTFMELKWAIGCIYATEGGVLIVPLWN